MRAGEGGFFPCPGFAAYPPRFGSVSLPNPVNFCVFGNDRQTKAKLGLNRLFTRSF